MSWKKKCTHKTKRGVDHQVADNKFRFYPNRMSVLDEASNLSEPLAKAINTLFADQSRDSGSSVKRTHDGDDFFVEDIETQPISIEMAKHRMDERNAAISTLLGTLADRRNMILLGKLFMDSLRDEFSYDPDRKISEIEDFLYGSGEDDDEYQGLDLPMLSDCFQGWMKANALVFGEAGESLVGLVRAKIEGLANSSLETTEPTNGEPSKTPSLPQSDQDSQPNT